MEYLKSELNIKNVFYISKYILGKHKIKNIRYNIDYNQYILP